MLTLENWIIHEETETDLKNVFGIDYVSKHNNKESYNYTDYIEITNTMLFVLIILFSIVLVVTNYNIIQDEKK